MAAAAVLAGIATRVRVVALAERTERQDAAERTDSSAPLWVREEGDFNGEAVHDALAADLIIDAIVGTGFQPPLRSLASAAIAAINRASGIVVSVDVPSGVDSDSETPVPANDGNMVFAHAVLALVAPKPAHLFGNLTAGPTAVSEIGIQPAVVSGGERLSALTGRDVCIAFPRRYPGMTAAEFGHVLIVGGARGSAGVAALAGLAALRSGAGRVTVACARSAESVVAACGAALLTRALSETNNGGITAAADELDDLLVGKRAVVLGPGLSVDPETTRLVGRLIGSCQVPLIIVDAALAAIAANYSVWNEQGPYRVICADIDKVGKWLRTLLGSDAVESPGLAKSISGRTGACVVLEGSRTMVAGPCGECWINLSGGPALAKMGMSEVLAGVIGAVLARSHESEMPDCASPAFHVRFLRDLRVAAAVHLHGLAADIACNLAHEHALMAENVLAALPEAFRTCDRQAESGLFYIHI